MGILFIAHKFEEFNQENRPLKNYLYVLRACHRVFDPHYYEFKICSVQSKNLIVSFDYES